MMDRLEQPIFPFGFPCLVAAERGRLEHSHLENAYLLLSPTRLFDVIEVKKDIPYEETINLCNKITKDIIDGYNPAQLVDLLTPFKSLSLAQRNMVKESITKIYENKFAPSKRREIIANAIKDFTFCANRFIEKRKTGEVRQDDDDSYQELKSAATKLRDILDALPKGIWMP